MTLAVRRYEPEDERAWDDLVSRSRSGHFLFRRGYMDYHADRFADHSLLVYDEGTLVAALPANVEGAAWISHGGLTFGGVLADNRMSTRRMLAVFDALLAYLRELDGEVLFYKPVPHIYHRTPAEEDLFALYRAGARLIRRDAASVICLDARVPYSKGRKADLKVAQRSGVTVGRSRDFGAFMHLQREVLQRRYDARPVHTTEELELLADRFPDEITLHVATVEGRLVAGVVMYETPVVARTQYIAVSEEGRATHALDKIVDELLGSYRGRKRWWDFGTSTLNAEGGLNEALIRNKESYGARTVVYDHYVLDVKPLSDTREPPVRSR